MTDEQIVKYLYEQQSFKTYEQIIEKTGKTYEELKQLYNKKVMPLNAKNGAKGITTNTGEKYIVQTKNGRFFLNHTPSRFSKVFDDLKDAIETRDKIIG